MSIELQTDAVKSKGLGWSRSALLLVVVVVFVVVITGADCAQLEPKIKLLINDEAFLLQQQKQAPPAFPTSGIGISESDSAGAAGANYQHYYDMYRSSELRRLSYETIHRILRDENEPIYRREEAKMRSFYRKRLYEPTHEVFRRAAQAVEKLASRQQPLQLLNLTNSNLTALPTTTPPGEYGQVRVLDLSGNTLREINLTLFPQLQWADLSHNALKSLPLTVNSTLIALNLNANRISVGSAPANWSHLRELHLSANSISNLALLNLSALHSLETLDLSSNLIETVETAFFPRRMQNLKYLNLAGNRLGCIYRETFYNLLSLNTLILTRNKITDIDYETFLALPNLQYLDLSHNQLRAESIRALQGIPELVGLSIAYNQELGECMQEFVASWSLKELDASGTGLCQIPAALAQSVRTLALSDNWLKIISCGDLDSYPLLQHLDLSRSHIADIEDDALGRLEILEVLFLDSNLLRKIPASLPVSLQHLFLQDNQIMDIQVQAFQGLNNLQTLDLSHNKLLYLPALALPKLLILNLQFSEVHGLNEAIVRTLPRLRDLLLEGNPIKCSELLGMAEWASPCVASEPGASARDLSKQKVLQESVKADLKKRFVQMHNICEHFKSECPTRAEFRHSPRAEHPPACAVELDADVASTAAPLEKVTTFNLPSEAPILQGSNLNSAVYESLAAVGTAEFAAPSPLQSSKYNEVNATTTNGTALACSTTAADSCSNNSNDMAAEVTAETILAAGAGTSKATTADTTEVTTTETFSHSTIKLPARKQLLAIKTTDVEDANRVELNTTHSNLINSKYANETTATATATATTAAATSAAINPKREQLMPATTKRTAETSTLNKTNVVGKKTTKMYATSAATTKPETRTTTTGPETASGTIYSLLPQTITATIKSASNYVETTSLLSRKGLKTSDAELLVAAARSDKIGSSSTELPKTENKLEFNGISAQPHAGVKPTTASPMLANNCQGNDLHQQLHPASQSHSHHKHSPLQLHVKDRHLIGTPLLVHKGQNILVEPEHLSLATWPTTAQSATANETQTETQAVTAGKGSRSADKLDRGQKSTGVKEPHLLAAITSSATELDMLPTEEAITPTANEQENGNDVVKLNSGADNDAQREEVINIIKSSGNATNAHLPAATQSAKIPKSGSSKKKLSLTMKKMTLTKQKHSAHSPNHEQHLQQDHGGVLNTAEENEAGTHRRIDGSVSILADRQLFKDLKSDLKENKPSSSLLSSYPPSKQHSSVNTAINRPELLRHVIHELPPHTAVEHHGGVSQSELWLDVRKAEEASGHPGLILLFSSVAIVALLLGLIQVYRCDKHWRRQPIAQRPHQRQLNEVGSGNSFLSFHNQQLRSSQTAFPQDWLHSRRLLTPPRLQLHNLHVRDLPKDATIQLPRNVIQRFSIFEKSDSTSSGSNTSTNSIETSSSSSSLYTSAIAAPKEKDAFHIEMTSDSNAPMGDRFHSDLLPMELLSSSAARQSPSASHTDPHTLPGRDGALPHIAPRVPATRQLFSNETAAMQNCRDDAVSLGSDKHVPLVKLTTTSRKFGLW